jgi:hypothetical protein
VLMGDLRMLMLMGVLPVIVNFVGHTAILPCVVSQKLPRDRYKLIPESLRLPAIALCTPR